MRALAIITALGAALPAAALDLTLPGNAQPTATRNSTLDVFAAPISVFASDGIELQSIEGNVERAAWRVPSSGLTPLQVIQPIRKALMDQGYGIVLDCAARACGGYDFRFQLEALPAPSMFINIRNYHHLTATKHTADGLSELITVLASTAPTVAHLQIIRGYASGADAALGDLSIEKTAPVPEAAAAAPVAPATAPTDLASALAQNGRAILDTLSFATGTTDLVASDTTQLADLAAIMRADPDVSYALVGHTDSVGGLSGNISISKRRAEAVRQRLISEFGTTPSQISAEGMGYLAPIANNLTPEGREANRRVEVIVVRSN